MYYFHQMQFFIYLPTQMIKDLKATVYVNGKVFERKRRTILNLFWMQASNLTCYLYK
jgi:hypothetical protein